MRFMIPELSFIAIRPFDILLARGTTLDAT